MCSILETGDYIKDHLYTYALIESKQNTNRLKMKACKYCSFLGSFYLIYWAFEYFPKTHRQRMENFFVWI